ncbi:hypothetical protein [Yeosuana sp. AK3]
MQKLSKEDIAFIDTYLKNSDIVFSDIRIEKVDHVASEIESIINDGDNRDFYYIFKDYMVKNKVDLLKESQRYYKASDKKILRKLIKKSWSLTGILVFFFTLFSFNLLHRFMEVQQVFSFIRQAPFVIFLITAVFYALFIKKNRERYSSLERLSLYFMIIGQLVSIVINSNKIIQNLTIENLMSLKIGSALIISLIILLVIIAFELKKEYHSKYKSVL